MDKKNKIANIIVIIIVAILVIASIMAYYKNKKEAKIEQQFIDQTESDLKNAAQSDTTESINNNINSITIDDITDANLQTIDQDLQKL